MEIRWLIWCVVCSLLVVGPLMADGAVSATHQPFAPLADELAKAIGAVLQIVIMVLGAAIAAKIKERIGIDISSAMDGRLHALALQAAAYAEELAAAELRGKLPSEAKLSHAVAWLQAHAPGLSRDEAERMVLAALPFSGIGKASKSAE